MTARSSPSNNGNGNGNGNNEQLFDIKVAVLGPVGTGKTTVVNALMGNEYGRVASPIPGANTNNTTDSSSSISASAVNRTKKYPNRTTSDVVYYHVTTISGTSPAPAIQNMPSFDHETLGSSYEPRSNITSHYHSLPEQEQQNLTYNVTSILPTNAQQHQQQQQQQQRTSVKEQHVDVVIAAQDDLFEMRNDTQLVLIDIPGLKPKPNQPVSSCPYCQYVTSHWDTFDCILVVLDVTQSPKEQQTESVVTFVRDECEQQTRRPPVLYVWNKVDDPRDPQSLISISQIQDMMEQHLSKKNTLQHLMLSRREEAARSDNAMQSNHNHGTIPFTLEVLQNNNSSKNQTYSGLFGPPMTMETTTSHNSSNKYDGNQHSNTFSWEALKKSKINEEQHSATATAAATTAAAAAAAATTTTATAAKVDYMEATSTEFSWDSLKAENGAPSKSLYSFYNAHPAPSPVPEIEHTWTTATPHQQPPLTPSPSQPQTTTTIDNQRITTTPSSPFLFLPLCAKQALIYKRVAQMTIDEFGPYMEQDWMVERLGRDQIGLRVWNTLSRDQQIQDSYQILQDPTEYNQGLESSGYTALVQALGDAVGNQHDNQTSILETRMEFSLRALLDPASAVFSAPNALLAPQMYSVYTKFQVLYGTTNAVQSLTKELQTAFWTAYDKMEVTALRQVLELGPAHVRALAQPMQQLISYYKISQLLHWSDSGAVVIRRMQQYLLQTLQLFLEQEALYDYEAWGDHFQALVHEEGTLVHGKRNPWTTVSPKDWTHIWSSILLVSYNSHFCNQFGREKLLLQELLDKAQCSWKTYHKLSLRLCPHCGLSLHAVQNEWRCDSCMFAFSTCFPSTQCNFCDHRFDYDTGPPDEPHVCPGSGFTYWTCQDLHAWMKVGYNRKQELVPVYPVLYERICSMGNLPASLDDANHVGHIWNEFCRFKEELSR